MSTEIESFDEDHGPEKLTIPEGEILNSRQNAVYKTLQGIHALTKDGSPDTFCKIFGVTGGDGNVWNIARRKGMVIKGEDKKYTWVGPRPTEFQAIDITAEAANYVEEKKTLRVAARSSILNAKNDIELIAKTMKEGGNMDFYISELRRVYKDLLVIEKYMAKNQRKPNPEYDGVGSV